MVVYKKTPFLSLRQELCVVGFIYWLKLVNNLELQINHVRTPYIYMYQCIKKLTMNYNKINIMAKTKTITYPPERVTFFASNIA